MPGGELHGRVFVEWNRGWKCRLQLFWRRVERDHVQGLADPLLDAAMAVTAAVAAGLDHDRRLPKETGLAHIAGPAVVVIVTT